jgi:hypothetical protein
VRINWAVFDDNTSTVEALIDFVKGTSVAALLAGCWPKACKTEVKKLRKLKVSNARSRAKRWLVVNHIW